jgi:7-cyano-7-deazaguanine reductase
MAIAEGRTIPFTGPEAVDVGVLETFEYAGPDQEIVTETREFSPVCPYSGLPDFATLRITYVPSDRCIELKSLKYYVTSYRSVGIFQEHATAKIAEDLQRVLQATASLGRFGIVSGPGLGPRGSSSGRFASS